MKFRISSIEVLDLRIKDLLNTKGWFETTEKE